MEKTSWQSLIIYYNLAPLVLEVYQPRKLITHLNHRRPYLVSKRKNGFLLSPITKQDKNSKENEPKKIKYLWQFVLDLKCDCLEFASFVNLNTQILVPTEEWEEFNQRHLVDRRAIEKVHECLFSKQLTTFKLALTIYWSQSNQDLIRIEVVKAYHFLLTVFMPVLMRSSKYLKGD